ncbi:unnamed protein product [Ectocarpus sp. 4 AP-2014]
MQTSKHQVLRTWARLEPAAASCPAWKTQRQPKQGGAGGVRRGASKESTSPSFQISPFHQDPLIEYLPCLGGSMSKKNASVEPRECVYGSIPKPKARLVPGVQLTERARIRAKNQSRP